MKDIADFTYEKLVKKITTLKGKLVEIETKADDYDIFTEDMYTVEQWVCFFITYNA